MYFKLMGRDHLVGADDVVVRDDGLGFNFVECSPGFEDFEGFGCRLLPRRLQNLVRRLLRGDLLVRF